MSTPPRPPHRRDPQRREELIDAVIDLTVTRGLDTVSVRDVAAAAGVSIGTVQHHFTTKDDMLLAAFERVVDQTRARLGGLQLGEDRRANMSVALQQLLPLDAARGREAILSVAFAARAAHAPRLRAVQARLLTDIRDEIAAVLGPDRETDAALLLAVVDGLTLQQVSAQRGLSRRRLVAVLEHAIDAVA